MTKNAIRGRRRIEEGKGNDDTANRNDSFDTLSADSGGNAVSDFSAYPLTEEIAVAFKKWASMLPTHVVPNWLNVFAAGWHASADYYDARDFSEPDDAADTFDEEARDLIEGARVPSDMNPTAPDAEFSRLEMEGVKSALLLLAARVGADAQETVQAMLYRGRPVPAFDIPSSDLDAPEWDNEPPFIKPLKEATKAPLDYETFEPSPVGGPYPPPTAKPDDGSSTDD